MFIHIKMGTTILFLSFLLANTSFAANPNSLHSMSRHQQEVSIGSSVSNGNDDSSTLHEGKDYERTNKEEPSSNLKDEVKEDNRDQSQDRDTDQDLNADADSDSYGDRGDEDEYDSDADDYDDTDVND